jgi:tetratricopeptide (TPR) repeat protein
MYVARGGSYHALGQHDKGIADRNEAIRLNPKLPEAWCARGNAYYLLGEYDKAIADLKTAMQLRPEFKDAAEVLALAETKQAEARVAAERSAAEKTAEKPAENNVSTASLKANIGHNDASDLSGPDGDTEPAAAPTNEKAREQKPKVKAEPPKPKPLTAGTTPDAYHTRGRELIKRKEYAKAIEELNTAIKMKPDYALAYNARGFALLQQKNLPAAIQDFSQAIKLNPGYENAYRNRAMAKKLAGDAGGYAQDVDQADKIALAKKKA